MLGFFVSMKICRRIVCLLSMVLLTHFSFGQITSGSVEGKVTDDTGTSIPGADVRMTHVPTGSTYQVVASNNGNFAISNLKPGGPYEILVSFFGFDDYKEANLYVPLGEVLKVEVVLQTEGSLLDSVIITQDASDPFKSDREGISTNIDEEQINKMPTLNRSIQDITRLVPQGGQSSFGGTNYRYNNLSVDGASNNDVLGFQEPASGAAGSVASGTPGALAGTQPISMDAIQEVQVSLAPFDVRQGNSTGTTINAVTRSGTNVVDGSVYSFGRNQILTGKSVDNARTPIADYFDLQSGFRIGAPIKKNKAFVFINYELGRRKEPVLNAPGDPGTQIPLEIAQAVSDTLRSRYNYDPGSYGELFNERRSDKFFVRVDFNLGQNHQLIVRDNLVLASADNLERGATVLTYANRGFTHNSVTNSFVTELKSLFKNNISNHFSASFNRVEDDRSYDGDVFPHVEINYNTANKIFLGTYREASIYGLTLNTTQVSDNIKIHRDKHVFTIGTSNDFYDIQYRFLTAWNGRWEYKSLDDFYNDMPSRVRGVYHYTDNSFGFNKSNPSADFRVVLLSGYVQDKYKPANRLTITGGVRLDMQLFPDKVPINPDVVNTPEFAHFDNQFGGVPQINPRVQAEYILNEEKTMQLRAGSGLFTGRIPFAWYAYSHYISGLNYGNIDYRPDSTLPITTDLSSLQSLQPGLTEINLVDNDFKLPRNWRSTLAFDFKFPDQSLLTIEGMYSKVITDVQFQNINLKDSTMQFSGADNRAYYLGDRQSRKVNPNFTNVFLLTNTNQGYQYFATISWRKQLGSGIHTSVAYTYGESKDIMNGVRNSMAANFSVNQAVNSNDPELTWSNFDVRHRIVYTASYDKVIKEKNRIGINLIYTGRSGSPFSYTYEGDLNNDASSRNDLIYVPASQDEIALIDITDETGMVTVSTEEQWQQLDEFIRQDEYLSSRRGGYAQRNGARTPWNHGLDTRFSYERKLKNKQRIELNLDIINVLALLNRNWGRQYFVPNVNNSTYQLISYEGISDNTPEFQFYNPQGTPWQIDQLNSRWQMQLGVRFSF